VQTRYAEEAGHYTNPNASCPVCGVRVFFYQAPDGGRVFFDELGPPWPKHPCTDNSESVIGKRHISSKATSEVRTFRWQRDGWYPFICERVARVPPDFRCLAVAGLYNDSSIALYVCAEALFIRAPYQMKRRDDSTYLLSTVQIQGGTSKPVELVAYRHLADALFASPIRAARAIPPRRFKKISGKPKQKGRARAINQANSSNSATPETTIELAFQRAIRKQSKGQT
jgi:hypothetical protein